MTATLPYRIAVLCYLFNGDGQTLLLHRRKDPNQDLYSPIGGKLDQACGESPSTCALREIGEEAGLELNPTDLHLTGLVSEAAYGGNTHWLMFLFEVVRPVEIDRSSCSEGCLEWHPISAIPGLALPETDRQVIWPLFWRYRGRFFAVHIDCTGTSLRWRLEQPAVDARYPDPLNGSATQVSD